MDFIYFYNSFIESERFLKEQILLEKYSIEKIIKNCFQYKDKPDFDSCRQNVLSVRKSFKRAVNLLESDIQREIKKKMNNKCSQIDSDEEFINCLNETSKEFDYKKKEFEEFITLLRRKSLFELK